MIRGKTKPRRHIPHRPDRYSPVISKEQLTESELQQLDQPPLKEIEIEKELDQPPLKEIEIEKELDQPLKLHEIGKLDVESLKKPALSLDKP